MQYIIGVSNLMILPHNIAKINVAKGGRGAVAPSLFMKERITHFSHLWYNSFLSLTKLIW